MSDEAAPSLAPPAETAIFLAPEEAAIAGPAVVEPEKTTTATATESPVSTITGIQSIAKIADLSPTLIGSTVKLHGWVYSTRTQGAGTLVFVDLGDGTTVTPCRCIAEMAGASAENADNAHFYGSTLPVDDKPTHSDEASYYQLLTFDQMTQSSFLTMGCSVQVIGYVAQPPEGTTQSYEVKLLQCKLIGKVPDASQYPIQKSLLKKPAALRGLSHARFRAPLIQQLMQIRSQALFAVHEFFHTDGVPLLDPNILTSSDCEGAGEVFKISPQMFHNLDSVTAADKPDDADAAAAANTPANSVEVGLTVSSQLPLEAIAMGTRAVYTCQKSFRAEKSDTNKHLAEFLHIEYEEYFNTLDTLMDQTERFVKTVIRTTLDRCPAQYAFLNGKQTGPDECHGHDAYLRSLLDKPFVRIQHTDAITLMNNDLRAKAKMVNEQGKEVKLKFKVKPAYGEDLGAEHEKYLVQKFGTFVFVTHWPSAIKSFYMKQVDAAPAAAEVPSSGDSSGDATTTTPSLRVCESFDLLAPKVGELFGGSMREWRHDVLVKEMEARKMDATPLQWYVDLRKDGGTAPHGGWGMGFDRLVMLLTNMASVRDIVPYPVYYGHCPY